MRKSRWILVSLVMSWRLAYGATFPVNSTADSPDANPGDGLCDDGAGACTLRAAVEESNVLAGPDIVSVPAGNYLLTGVLSVGGEVTITGAGAASTIIDGNFTPFASTIHVDGGGTPMANGVVTISAVTVRNGFGGGLNVQGYTSLTLADCVISDNGQAGIFNQAPANENPGLTVRDCLIADNAGPGISNVNTGVFLLERVTLTNNQSNGDGGGIWNLAFGDPSTVKNSTISGNRATGSGGGIYGPVVVKNATIVNNTADSDNDGAGDGGGIWGGNVDFSIVAGNIDMGGEHPDCVGAFFPTFMSIVQDADDCSPSIYHVDPLLGPLVDGGSGRLVHLPLQGSPAVNRGCFINGNSSLCCEQSDQRGLPRGPGDQSSPFGDTRRCDLGAVEVQPCEYVYTGCLRTTKPGRPLLKLKDSIPGTGESSDQLKWVWSNGAATTAAEFQSLADFSNDDGTESLLCIFDESTAPPLVRKDQAFPELPYWRDFASGTKYVDRAGSATGLTLLKLKGGDAGKAKIVALVKGPNSDLPPLPLNLPLRVQLQAPKSGRCWEAEYDTANIATTNLFVAHGD